MNHPLYYTAEEAEAVLRKYGDGSPKAESIRAAAANGQNIGFPVSVIGTRVYIPRKSFDLFWGIDHGSSVGEVS